MVSMLSVLPPATSQPSGVSLPGVVISLGIGVAVWLVATFVISRITRRVASGSNFFKKPTFKWAAPAFRALDHERRVQRAETIGSLLNSVVGVLVVIITGMYVLQNLDINIAPLLTSVGILGVAIGFGAQQLIRDFLAGIFITIEDQYGIGDVIETSEVVGVVESMGLRITRVRSDDGATFRCMKPTTEPPTRARRTLRPRRLTRKPGTKHVASHRAAPPRPRAAAPVDAE